MSEEYETVRIEVWARTDKVGSECSDTTEVEIPAGLAGEEREAALEKEAHEAAHNFIEWGFEEVGAEE